MSNFKICITATSIAALFLATLLLGPLLVEPTVVAQTTNLPLPTTLQDFFQPGSQPNTMVDTVIAANGCALCHADFNPNTAPEDRWKTSIMAQATRDPLFHACLAIAEQDAAFVGDLCIRCHTPNAWLDGRSTPTNGSALTGFMGDFDGVSCHFCHRMVDPVYDPGNSPAIDQSILAGLVAPPPGPAHNGQYVIDPIDRRRGPYDLVNGFSFHAWENSSHHREAEMCGTCHDVSNPAYTRINGVYVLNAVNTPHPTHDRYDQFPIERTYSEWLMSDFAIAPIDMGGRYGGNDPLVSTCQDCHMPKTAGYGCMFTGSSIFRSDLAQHDFAGSHTWILDSILDLDVSLALYDVPSFRTQAEMNSAKLRNIAMLESASDLELSIENDQLKARVINQTGHKLPSGYPEGRRIWVNVRYLDAAGDLVAERGAYDFDTADLITSDTKVYETHLGLDAAMATVTGLPEGEGFHFALNNKIYKDNRIPPRGFTNAGFAAVQAAPVDYTYADGEYWDDTFYTIPGGAVTAEVKVYYQTASKEYIQFLKDENTTNNAGNVLWDVWMANGKGAPVIIDDESIALPPQFVRNDCNRDGGTDISDPIYLLNFLFGFLPAPITCDDACDGNDDGNVDISDPVHMLSGLFAGGMFFPPHPDCGFDATADPLDCAEHGSCP
ncbi:MAG: hypothetical protein AAF581_08200 [Planctomycetota bacterium]